MSIPKLKTVLDKPKEAKLEIEYVEMTVKLDTTLGAFERDGGDKNFIKNVTKLLKIDRKLMVVTAKR